MRVDRLLVTEITGFRCIFSLHKQKKEEPRQIDKKEIGVKKAPE